MKTHYGRLFLAIAATITVACSALQALAAGEQISQGKVAVVNGSVITQEDFDREIDGVLRRLASMGRSFDDSQLLAIRKEVLEGLINTELLYQETQRRGITVEEAAIDEELKTLKGGFANEDEFSTALSKANLSEALIRSQIKRRQAIENFIAQQFAETVTVSDKEAKDFYESHPDSFKQPEQVRASHILIKIDPQADESQRAQARQQIEHIQRKLQEGEDFATLAKTFSQDPSGARGGDLGYFRRGEMVKPFEEAAFALKPGEVSDPVESTFGYHLITVIDKKPETTIAYEDIKDRIEHYLKDKNVQEKVRLQVQRLKEKAKVEIFLTQTPK
jgi:peptidyl-prolyl cis-trans isomerase C